MQIPQNPSTRDKANTATWTSVGGLLRELDKYYLADPDHSPVGWA